MDKPARLRYSPAILRVSVGEVAMAVNMEGEERIPAPVEKVWAALNDPDILRACIPGCESLEKKSDTELEATVALKIGPIKARFADMGGTCKACHDKYRAEMKH